MSQKDDRTIEKRKSLHLPPREEVVARIRETKQETEFLRKLLRVIESRDESKEAAGA